MTTTYEQRLRVAKERSRIYFDHAATTAPRQEVVDVVKDILENTYGNPSSFYAEGHRAAHILEMSRQKVADCLQVSPDEIFFTSCGTESDNWAIKGVAHARRDKGRHLITTTFEHHAVLHPMQELERDGYDVTYLEVDEYGLIDPEQVREALRPDTILVSIMMANNEIGTIEPIKEIGAICREARVLFHSDGVQALGAVPVLPRELNCDIMSFSGHKLYAPKGVGLLYKRKGIRMSKLLNGGAQEFKQRGGTENVAYAAAIAKALELAVESMHDESKRQIALRDRLIQGVFDRISHVKLNGHPTRRLPNNVNLSFEFIEGESILLLLDALGYACSSGSACTSASLDPSHVLLAIGMPAEVAHGSLRVTIGRETTDHDIDEFLIDLPLVIERLRNMSPLYTDYREGRLEALIPEEGGLKLNKEGGYGI